jgi:CheY-like chemotaxis protein
LLIFFVLAVLPDFRQNSPSRSTTLNSVSPCGFVPTILVVEDDPAIRYLLTHVLEALGYLVIACEDGTRGMAVASAQIHRLDAVITDSTMPGMEGRELLARIRALRAELPVLVVSGSIEDPTVRAAEDPFTIRLSKPVSPDRLRLELRRLLSSQADGGSSQPSVR